MKKFIALLLTVLSFSSLAQAVEDQAITLTTTNVISLRSEVTEESVAAVIMALTVTPADRIYLFINSPGGSILAGNQLIAAIKSSNKHITCIADFAASMAFSILQACHVRYITIGAVVMQHQASYGAEGSIVHMKTTLEFVEKLVKKLNEDDAARIGIPVADFRAKIHDEWWLFDREIVTKGVADAQVKVRCSPFLAHKREVQRIDSLFGTATVVWSSCPLITYPLSVKIERKSGVDYKEFVEWARSLKLDQNWKIRKEVK